MNPNPMIEPDTAISQRRFIFPLFLVHALSSPQRFNVSTLLALLLLFPGMITAQTAQLTERLGRTVLYDDIAVSPDGKWVAWVQSTAAIAPKSTYICSTTAGFQA